MKTILGFTIVLHFGLLFFSCGQPYRLRSSLTILADSIAQYNVAEGPMIGMMPREKQSDQFIRFLRLVDSSDTRQLLYLSQHSSPVVRYYSLLGLSRRDSDGVFQALLAHLHDTSKVETALFDMHQIGPISWYVATEFLDYYFTVNKPKERYYAQIKKLAQDTLVPAALVALSRFRRPEDANLIDAKLKQALEHWYSNRARPHYSLLAVREFPSQRFFSSLEEALTLELQQCDGSPMMNLALMQAIAQYPRSESVQLFKAALAGCSRSGGKREMMAVYVTVALSRYPNPMFDELQHSITLSPSGKRLAEYWNKE